MQDNHRLTYTPLPKVSGGWYEIRVQERIGASWAAWFEGLEIHHQSDGTTLLTGLMVDQSALHGVLVKIRDMHLTLLSLQLVGFRL